MLPWAGPSRSGKTTLLQYSTLSHLRNGDRNGRPSGEPGWRLQLPEVDPAALRPERLRPPTTWRLQRHCLPPVMADPSAPANSGNTPHRARTYPGRGHATPGAGSVHRPGTTGLRSGPPPRDLGGWMPAVWPNRSGGSSPSAWCGRLLPLRLQPSGGAPEDLPSRRNRKLVLVFRGAARCGRKWGATVREHRIPGTVGVRRGVGVNRCVLAAVAEEVRWWSWEGRGGAPRGFARDAPM